MTDDFSQYIFLSHNFPLSLSKSFQEPSLVGTMGLHWFFLSYGYILFFASNLISEGSEYLLLVPELAGLVNGILSPPVGCHP